MDLIRIDYLTTDVIKATALQNILPTAMLLEVCLANPDATKSDEILDFLEYEIPNPLPSFMIDLINSSRDSVTTRTNLESSLAQRNATYSFLGNKIKSNLTINPDLYNSDSLLHYTASRNDLASKYSSIDLLINKKNFTLAQDSLELIPICFNLKPLDQLYYTHYSTWFDFQKNISIAQRNLLQLDSNEVDYLKSLENDFRDNVGTAIANILCFGYHYCKDDNIAESVGVSRHGLGQNKPTDSENLEFVYPNPANTFFVVDLHLLTTNCATGIILSDASGRQIFHETITNPTSINVFDCHQITNGIYFYKLIGDKKQLLKGKIEIHH